ncbi:MAG: 16S rRNA (cytosine(1402)-N(4))-methyltransferase RsmH, partial [Spirochaetota bacterium]|nr:16S rRNA (cytosine(1402)-N(4))-methyltransferase RsmH [Spirochaetota bacterium]
SNVIVDCTVGEGGHSEFFLSRLHGGKLIVLDRDKEILDIARKRLSDTVKNEDISTEISFIESNFSNLHKVLDDLAIEKVDFMLYDLGISMYHFKGSMRGFSFMDNESLDMRLDANNNLTAYEIVNKYTENEIREILFTYGEEHRAKLIAKNIVRAREKEIIKTAYDLQLIISKCVPKKYPDSKINPATKTFQALRIFVNRELEHIEKALIEGINKLCIGGRLLVISFHSLEDRIVKQVFKHFASECICPKSNPVCQCDGISTLKILTKKPITPNKKEIEINPASRSAKLRVVEKINETSNKVYRNQENSYQKRKKLFSDSHYISHSSNY